ncbi:MAG: sigma-70 family RNA polymerase sigma factor [Ktedonobacteraceae bacterium]
MKSINFAEDNNALSVYLHEIGHVPLLSAKDEVRLAQQIEAGRAELRKPVATRQVQVVEAGEQATIQFVEANLRLVISQVRAYVNYVGTTLSFLDLCQEGNIGLLRALEKYDWRKGYKFSTFATWWIRQALGRAHHDQSRLVRIPVYMSEKLSRIKRANVRLSEQLGIPPTTEQIADHLKLPLATVLDVLAHDYRSVSLEKPLNGAEDQSLGSLLEEQEPEDVTEQVSHNVVAEQVREALNQARLTERERQVVELRYGLQDNRDRSLEEVARVLTPTITRERVRQIEAKAFSKLRPFLRPCNVA